eukprot:jgi/Tetstr1/441737/TSEL_029960.t1
MRDATQAQLDFMATELPRFEAIGAWERGHCNKWVSRMFLVPKPGTNKWRLIIDLRELNKWCKTFTMSYETLKHLRHLARAGDWFVSMDLADGYYALGIREEDRDFFTVNYRGELWRLACLPMGWTGSSYYFCKLTAAFTDYLRTPLKRRDPALPPTAPSKPTRRFLRNTRWRGERLLPYMDDFLFLADSREAALELRVRLSTLLDRLGLLRNPNKGVWEPTQVGPHLGLIIDLKRGEFRAPEEKLIALAKAARSLLGRAASNKRWLPARQLASFAGKAQFLYLAVTPARFFLRELHCVLATRQGWGGRVKMTNQLRRDLEWWTQVPAQHNGRSMYKPVETAYLHADSSSYEWGAVLNNNSAYQARGFWYEDDRSHHITWKELRAVRHAVESFLPQLRGRRVLLHEDNTAVVAALTNLTSRSPVMMEELRKLWHLLDIHDISIRPRYIQSAANVWADRLSRELDDSDWQLNPRIFAYLQRLWGRAMAVQPSLQYSVQYPGRLSHTRRARYRLAVRSGSEAPWSASMAAELRSLLGTDDVGQAALGLLTGSLAAGTYRNYDSGMRSFATFCEQEGLRPLQATTSTIVRYTAWLGMQGTVGAESLQQYYSSINKYFRDHQRQPIALGEMVADARRGLAIQQERLAAEDVRVALPAPVAADILNTAIGFRQTLVWEPANIADIRAFRAALATITAYVFLCRAESGISCETGDLVVDRPSGSILLYVRKQKGDQRTRVSAKPLINLPIAAVPDFAALLDWYAVSRDAYCRRFYGASPPPKFWSISPLESSATWSVSATLTEWLREAYMAAGARPPTGFKWTSHSLRKGAASAASCVGVPLPAIKHMGDWSKNSEVVTGKYIDPTMRPTPAAWRFFGWLGPVRPPA